MAPVISHIIVGCVLFYLGILFGKNSEERRQDREWKRKHAALPKATKRSPKTD